MSVDVRTGPLPGVVGALAQSVRRWPRLALDGRLARPKRYVGAHLTFADGTTSVVFRETVLAGIDLTDPCVLIVHFRLRLLGRTRLPHALFRLGCIVNTPLFVGFDGFVTKLWLADLETGAYRGVYDWNGAQAAHDYAEPLCALLRTGSLTGSVRYHVVESTTREAFTSASPAAGFEAARPGTDHQDDWWRLRQPIVMPDRGG